MLNRARKLLNRGRNESGFTFERPLVLIQSDDWGRVGVRDRDGFEELRSEGLLLGQHPYDFYSLETAEDVIALRDMLQRHRDSSGRPPCVVMNFLTANFDFPKIQASDFQRIELLSLSRGLPGKWKRPGLIEAYKQGISDGVFYPALHGLTHCCQAALEFALTEAGERQAVLRQLWRAEASYIYWRMPWIGYEYWNPEKPKPGFLAPEAQENLIRLAAEGFAKLFSVFPESACAPGYRSNPDTHAAWRKWGLKVAQNGTGAPVVPFIDELEILNISRTIDFEPAQKDLPLEKYMQLAEGCIARGMPAIISVHSINFQSTLRNFREPALQGLDQLLTALEGKYPDLLYVHDADLYRIVTRGRFTSKSGPVTVAVKHHGTTKARSASWGAK